MQPVTTSCHGLTEPRSLSTQILDLSDQNSMLHVSTPIRALLLEFMTSTATMPNLLHVKSPVYPHHECVVI